MGEPRPGFRITSLWAFTAVDEDDDEEGVTALSTPLGWLPMVGSDKIRVDELRAKAQQMATESGRTIKLARFDVRTDLEEFTP